ncbi:MULTISPECIES: DinB family protein [Paenibacillus]|uniref:DinB family protein n=1 Tax=Paenibacillus TaxID=44249 RepID=UPI0022B85C4A|nr:DinB family protein [Paenibacillus caseinilyticus]MCZ8521713.1 DinB family protein [Paenibacillus caseinilyticus]
MSHTGIDLNVFAGNLSRIEDSVRGLTEEQLSWKPAPEKWSIKEVVSHLTDHLVVTGFRIRQIVSESVPQLPAFDQDAWVTVIRANEVSLEEHLGTYEALLAVNVPVLQRLEPEAWLRTAVNPRGKTVTLAELLEGFSKHVGVHLDQIERNKQALAQEAAPSS